MQAIIFVGIVLILGIGMAGLSLADPSKLERILQRALSLSAAIVERMVSIFDTLELILTKFLSLAFSPKISIRFPFGRLLSYLRHSHKGGKHEIDNAYERAYTRIRFLLRRRRMINDPERKRRIQQPPGATLLKIVEFLYKPKFVEETFKPIVADWRVEYFNALTEGRTVKARWISIRYRYSFIIAMGLSKFFSLLKNITSAIK